MSKTLLTGMKYTSSAATDIRQTFARVDPNWNKRPKRKAKPKPKPLATVTQLKERRHG